MGCGFRQRYPLLLWEDALALDGGDLIRLGSNHLPLLMEFAKRKFIGQLHFFLAGGGGWLVVFG